MNELTPYQKSQLEIIRRCLYRGKRLAEEGEANCSDFIDLFVHTLDEWHRLRDTYD